MSLTDHFASGIKRFFSGIFLSRITGLGRDLAMAYAFGDHPTVAAFMIAFRLSHLFRRFFGEGPLQSAFIPHFEELRLKDSELAYTFFRKLTFFLLVVLTGIVCVLEMVLGLSSHLPLSDGNLEVIALTKSLLPSLLFICLYGLNTSLLQSHNTFFLSSMAPALCNILWIIGALSLKSTRPSEAIPMLTLWVVGGFILQWLITMPKTWKTVRGHLKEWIDTRFYKPLPEMKVLLGSFTLGVLGVGATQINAFFDSVFARCAHPSGPVYLWYSIRFQQLALAIFGIAAVNTLVPLLSRALKGGDREKGEEIFQFGVRRIVTVMIPCTALFCVLGDSMIDLFFGRGSFSHEAVQTTSVCLSAYGLGLLPATLVMLYSAIYYAEGDFRTPALHSTLSVALNLGMNALFVFAFGLGAVSTALATSLSSGGNAFLLWKALAKKGWKHHVRPAAIIQVVVAAGLASLSSVVASKLVEQKSVGFLLGLILFGGTFFSYGKVFRNADIRALFGDYFNLKKGRRQPSQS